MASKIAKIGITNELISGRGGLGLFLRYVNKIDFYRLIEGIVSPQLTLGHKGLKLRQFIKQILAYFMDGTHMSLSGFEQKKNDKSYAAILENTLGEMASSHQIKRYFTKLSVLPEVYLRKVLHQLFLWRLGLEKPSVIKLFVDTMVMDNDLSKKKEGNGLTYKKKFGFQPLHIIWNNFIVDAMFRHGTAHSNHGTDFTDRVGDIVKLIRDRYSESIPIILCADGGFSGDEAFKYFEETLKIHFIINSKVYPAAKDFIEAAPDEAFLKFDNGQKSWGYIEFGNKLKVWNKFRRCIFTRIDREEDGQYILGNCKSDSFLYTNLGLCKEADENLKKAGGQKYFSAKSIIAISHAKGKDEQVHRSIKELATKEQLPFKRFGMNRVYYFLLIFSHFIFESYKSDVAKGIIARRAYPNTFRRLLIDFAVKLTSQARYIILKVERVTFDNLKVKLIWERCQSPPKIQFE